MKEKLYQVLEQALKDFEAFVAAGNRVDMSTWLKLEPQADYPGMCRGCLGGAYLYARLGLSPERVIITSPGRHIFITIRRTHPLGETYSNVAGTLDLLRAGNVDEALLRHYAQPNKMIDNFDVPPRDVVDYEDNPDGWWADMRQILKELKEHDL